MKGRLIRAHKRLKVKEYIVNVNQQPTMHSTVSLQWSSDCVSHHYSATGFGTYTLNTYAKRGTEYGMLFICSLFCEYSHIEYVRNHVIYRVHQAAYVIYNLAVAPQKYVNIYSTRRVGETTTRRNY